jgi:putative aldouronate transport system substrate-binding protein
MKETNQRFRTAAVVLKSILMAGLALALLAACSGSGSSGGAAASASGGGTAAPTEVTFYMISFNNIPESTADVEKAINDHIAATYPDANVALKLQIFGPADYAQKIQLALSSGSPIDIAIPLPLEVAVSQGQCLPIEDLLDTSGKEMKAMVQQDMGENNFDLVSKNGHIYAVPVSKGVVVTPTFIYDKDMMAATGMSIDNINSIRDLPALFDKILAQNPNVFPFANTNQQDSGIMQVFCGEQEIDSLGSGQLSPMFGVSMKGSNKVVNVYESPEFAQYIGMMRDWYNKGYFPKDMATSTSTATEYIAAGRDFSTLAGYGGAAIDVTISATTGKDIGIKWIAPFYMDSSSIAVDMAIMSTSKDPAAAMNMLNIIYIDAFVVNTILYGIEGRDYVQVDEHHWSYPEGQDPNSVPYTAAYSTGVVGSEKLQLQPVGMSYDDVLLKYQQNQETKRSPWFGFVFDSSSVIAEITALNNVYTQYMPGLSCGSTDPATGIAEFNAALHAAGIDKVIAAKQQQLDAWIAARQSVEGES